MQNILHILYKKFFKAIIAAFPDIEEEVLVSELEITQSTQEKFGHYQCNSAMKFAGLLKSNPRLIAQKIVQHLSKVEGKREFVSSVEIAGAGFINVTVDPLYLSSDLQEMLDDPRLGLPFPKEVQKIVVDFSSPNVAKEMHVGHLRSTIIGDCLARLLEFLGHNVLRINHVGDWGTQFGMLIAYMKEEVSEVLSGKEEADLLSLMKWYRESKKKFDVDQDFKEGAQREVVHLQKGDEKSLKVWKMICSISRIAYQEIYDLLEVEIIERGESFYNSELPKVIEDLERKGLISVSNGAKCIFLEGFANREGDPLPMIVQKSDGAYNYATTDFAALRHRVEKEKADRIIYVTDMGQRTHFKMLFAAAERGGYLDSKKVCVDHVSFGLVLGPDGKKFKTRSGDTEKLYDLLSAAIEKAKSIMKNREVDLQEAEINEMSKILGIGAVKYADLSCHRTGDYTFSYDRMLRFEGNTAAFLMYAYVRVAGIKRKVNANIEEIKKNHSIHLEHPSEKALGIHLRRFGEVLELLSKELAPHRLTDYLYELAQKFNVFFRDCRVEGSNEENQRLLLCDLVAKVMKQGLEILGVGIVERM